jgi:hypothetical protein
MFTLNAKLFGVSDEKLMDRLVEQWSFFFGNVLPYFEATFLPLRIDVRYASIDDKEYWNVRNMALQSFRDHVILPLIKRLEGTLYYYIGDTPMPIPITNRHPKFRRLRKAVYRL